ncbi:MAG: thioredoxin [Lachnospiraceae bacterium]|jgi:thioredoxin 1|nr:thioredoxin [Lachnospiraceae bacterium]
MSNASTVNIANFQTEIMSSDKTVLIDFWAPWCGPCKEFAPTIEEIEKEKTDIKVVKIDVSENPELAKAFKVFSIPTLMVVKNGKIASRSVGVKDKADVLSML